MVAGSGSQIVTILIQSRAVYSRLVTVVQFESKMTIFSSRRKRSLGFLIQVLDQTEKDTCLQGEANITGADPWIDSVGISLIKEWHSPSAR